MNKTQTWLIDTNKKSDDPLKVLEFILEDFLEKQIKSTWYNPELGEQLKEEQEAIREALQKSGITYRNGCIQRDNKKTASTLTLFELVKKNDLPAIEQEIHRALEQVDKDPYAACLFASNLLEATLKHYITEKGHTYDSNDGLSELWKKASRVMNITPKNFDDADLKCIASSLIGIVNSLRNIRNKKSAAHGKSENERKQYRIQPRHSRLAIHSAHTLAAYILELV